MTKQVIKTDKAPGAVGPYSQGIIANGLVFTAGQIPLIPGTKQLAEGITEQTRQSLENAKGVLEAAGSSMDKVVKVTVFLADMGEFGEMNAVYGTYFEDNPPARSTVQAARLPLDARVEIEMIALL